MIRVEDDLLLLLPLRVVDTKDAGNILLEFVGVHGYRRRLTLDRQQLEATALAMGPVVEELKQADVLRKQMAAARQGKKAAATPAGTVEVPGETPPA